MRPSLLGWAFYSPFRLALVSIAVAGIVIGGALITTSGPGPGTDEVAQPVAHARTTPPPTPAEAGPTPTPSEGTGAHDRPAATTAARRFVAAWARGGQPTSRAEWLRTMRSLTTGALYRGLRVTDPDRLPRGRVVRLELRQIGAFGGSVVVTLSGGMAVQVQVVTENDRWVVADVRPAGS